MKLTRHSLIRWLLSLFFALAFVSLAQAQALITFQYFYDELGQLVKVVDSTGNVIEYVYDQVGNILEIKRSTAGQLDIFDFTPKQGPVGTAVTIQGQGFGATSLDNTVQFNGVSAEVTSATTTTLAVAALVAPPAPRLRLLLFQRCLPYALGGKPHYRAQSYLPALGRVLPLSQSA